LQNIINIAGPAPPDANPAHGRSQRRQARSPLQPVNRQGDFRKCRLIALSGCGSSAAEDTKERRRPPLLKDLAMKIRIEKAQCTGNARCHAVAEHLYPLDDEGYIAIEGFDVPPGQEALARRGARACPERIIFIVEDEA
jgi:ferredoxin